MENLFNFEPKIKTVSRQILEEEFNHLYNSMLYLIKEENPCKPHGGKCAGGNFCCHGCKYLGPKGCTVLALPCKTWFCHSAIFSRDFNIERHEIINKAQVYGFYGARFSRNDSLNRAFAKWNEFYNIKTN